MKRGSGRSRKSRWAAAAVVCLLLALPGGTALSRGDFPDTADHWARVEVAQLVRAGAVSGYTDGSFRPEGKVSRAEFVKMALVAAGLKPKSGAGCPFADAAGHWAAGHIEAAVEAGLLVVGDYPPGEFDPNRPITRQEIAAIVTRALGFEEQARLQAGERLPFQDDETISAWARGYIAVAVRHGIIAGFPDATFRPRELATRAQAAVMLVRVLRVRGQVHEAVGDLAFLLEGASALGEDAEGWTVALPGGHFLVFAREVVAGQIALTIGLDAAQVAVRDASPDGARPGEFSFTLAAALDPARRARHPQGVYTMPLAAPAGAQLPDQGEVAYMAGPARVIYQLVRATPEALVREVNHWWLVLPGGHALVWPKRSADVPIECVLVLDGRVKLHGYLPAGQFQEGQFTIFPAASLFPAPAQLYPEGLYVLPFRVAER